MTANETVAAVYDRRLSGAEYPTRTADGGHRPPLQKWKL